MKQIYQAIIVLILLLLIASPVAACSPAPISVKITCQDGATAFVSIERAESFLSELPLTCDIGNGRTLIAQEVQLWKDGWKGYFRGGSLTITPYDAQEETTVQRANANLLSCGYSETRRVGDWLLIDNTSRTYCHLEPFTPCCLCPDLRLSIFEFIIYLVSHPQVASLPYLGVFVLLIGAFVLLIRRLIRQKELWMFFRPRASTILLTLPIALICIWLFLAASIDLIGWTIVAYLLASTIMYYAKKRRPTQPTSAEG